MGKRKSNINMMIALGLVMGASAAIYMRRNKMSNESHEPSESPIRVNNKNGQVYFIGGGLASMAGAAYLIRDCDFEGANIHILEGTNVIGGSNNGRGNVINGFVSRGGRMLNEETYENFWELFSSIPSLETPEKSVTEEILNFDHQHPTHAQARLIDKDGIIQDVSRMGFNNNDRAVIGKLLLTPEEKLDDMTIEDWFKNTPHFFQTNFWHLWQTTFAFQKWSSLFEFRRYMQRMMFEFTRIDTLEGVTRTPYNQYDSIIVPLKAYLESAGVDFSTNEIVTDLDFKDGDEITVTAMHVKGKEDERVIELSHGDVCIMTNGSMTDCSSLGDILAAPKFTTDRPISAELWRKVAEKKEGLGSPEPFFSNPDKTNWESFTVTCNGNELLKLIEKFSGNIPGSGALMTFKDSSWLMSIVIAAQPHFKNQPMNTTIFWGYGLHTDRIGDYVKKPMRECNGKEILTELLYHLHMEEKLDDILVNIVNVIPCMMPYVNAQFQPHKMSDRPKVVPEGSTNFAMISQFVEIPEDMVFTEEYSVRAARIATYTLFGVKDKKVCPVTHHNRNPKVIKDAIKTSLT